MPAASLENGQLSGWDLMAGAVQTTPASLAVQDTPSSLSLGSLSYSKKTKPPCHQDTPLGLLEQGQGAKPIRLFKSDGTSSRAGEGSKDCDLYHVTPEFKNLENLKHL